MKQLSIFDGVVKVEDSYSNLLRNLMLKDVKYGREICDLLSPKPLCLKFDQLSEVCTQVSLDQHGRGDLLVESTDSLLLVEVKTDLYCPLTRNQEPLNDTDGSTGYLQYLKGRKRPGFSVGLCFLTPRDWIHRARKEKELQECSIPAQLVTWEEVCRRTVNGKFGALLEDAFMSISFEPEEGSLLSSVDGLKVFGSASLKLHGIVQQAMKELTVELRKEPDRRFKVRLRSEIGEHGAQVYENDKPVIWFGTWASSAWPLVVGFQKQWAVEKTLNLANLIEIASEGGWRTYQLPQECFTGETPLSHIINKLKQILGV